MTRETDEYTVDEAARLVGMSPARVCKMLRSGELEGERRQERVEGVLGPWRITAGFANLAPHLTEESHL
ncbi:MAG: helix-turn-helix domain-containing protein [Actinomycetota bacterium]|nr:helix-turn-helix domain-containing protein [Actinomycetota bacterium]